jgi:ankyrin repeat protein
MALYEAHHRRELRAEFETRARERADAEAVKRLFRGASKGDVDAVEGAMWAGADADAANPLDGGRTALHYACLAGERAVAQVLVEHGANPSALDGGGSTPADACVSGGKDQRGEIAGDLELARAAHAHMATLAMEINAGRYDVDKPGTSGSMPPLHEAVAARKGALTRFLLAQGASVEKTGGSEGDTPLHIAARTGQERMCRLLVLRGAAPDAVAAGGDGATPLHEALRGVKRNGAKGAHAKIAKLFMDEMKRLGRGAEAAAIIAGTRA